MNSKIHIIVLSLIVLSVRQSLSEEIDPNYNYATFMVQFGRTYTGEEKDQHEQIFN